MHGLEHMGR